MIYMYYTTLPKYNAFGILSPLSWFFHAYTSSCSGERYCPSASRLLGLVLLKSSAEELSHSWVYLVQYIQVIAAARASIRKLAVLCSCCHVDLSIPDILAFMAAFNTSSCIKFPDKLEWLNDYLLSVKSLLKYMWLDVLWRTLDSKVTNKLSKYHERKKKLLWAAPCLDLTNWSWRFLDRPVFHSTQFYVFQRQLNNGIEQF